MDIMLYNYQKERLLINIYKNAYKIIFKVYYEL